MPRRKMLKRPPDPFRWFDSSPEGIRLVVMMYVKYPLSLRNVEDLLHERGINICHETVRLWWRRFGPMFANEVRKKRVEARVFHADARGFGLLSSIMAAWTLSGALIAAGRDKVGFGSLLPSRRGCGQPRPSQTRTCGFPASGSSRASFAQATPNW